MRLSCGRALTCMSSLDSTAFSGCTQDGLRISSSCERCERCDGAIHSYILAFCLSYGHAAQAMKAVKAVKATNAVNAVKAAKAANAAKAAKAGNVTSKLPQL